LVLVEEVKDSTEQVVEVV
jgi:hypothetical protein